MEIDMVVLQIERTKMNGVHKTWWQFKQWGICLIKTRMEYSGKLYKETMYGSFE